jgi:hypothetical protein
MMMMMVVVITGVSLHHHRAIQGIASDVVTVTGDDVVAARCGGLPHVRIAHYLWFHPRILKSL